MRRTSEDETTVFQRVKEYIENSKMNCETNIRFKAAVNTK